MSAEIGQLWTSMKVVRVYMWWFEAARPQKEVGTEHRLLQDMNYRN